MSKTKASKKALDFSGVKDGSIFSTAHLEEGDYSAKIIQVEDRESKDGEDMWVFAIQLNDRKSAVYPFYCKLVENQLWKLRNLLIAAGKSVPKKRVAVDPNSIVGKAIGVTLEDDEYEGRLKSSIAAVFPASELADDEDPDEDTAEELELDEDEDDDEEEEEAPKKKKKAKASAPAKKSKKAKKKADDDDELDLDDL